MKIKNWERVGYMTAYSPEMSSPQHNYLTGNSRAVHKNSHACAYAAVMAYRCAWFKAHFFPEWIASVLSNCDPKKAPRYISIARNEGWKPTDITRLGRDPKPGYDQFEIIPVDINNLNPDFSVIGNVVSVGLLTIKGLGESNRELADIKDTYESLDDFLLKIEMRGLKAGKMLCERLIRLGAFDKLPQHGNKRALWYYYSYTQKKFSSTERKAVNAELLAAAGWTQDKIEEERTRQVAAYQAMYPKRNPKGFPKKVTAWVPPDKHSLEMFNATYTEYSITEILDFELEYLGYNLANPMLMYDTRPSGTIDNCIEECSINKGAVLECIINEVHRGETKEKKENYCRLEVTDGRKTTTVFIWSNVLGTIPSYLLRAGVAVAIPVQYQPKFKSFAALRGNTFIPLRKKEEDG